MKEDELGQTATVEQATQENLCVTLPDPPRGNRRLVRLNLLSEDEVRGLLEWGMPRVAPYQLFWQRMIFDAHRHGVPVERAWLEDLDSFLRFCEPHTAADIDLVFTLIVGRGYVPENLICFAPEWPNQIELKRRYDDAGFRHDRSSIKRIEGLEELDIRNLGEPLQPVAPLNPPCPWKGFPGGKTAYLLSLVTRLKEAGRNATTDEDFEAIERADAYLTYESQIT